MGLTEVVWRDGLGRRHFAGSACSQRTCSSSSESSLHKEMDYMDPKLLLQVPVRPFFPSPGR